MANSAISPMIRARNAKRKPSGSSSSSSSGGPPAPVTPYADRKMRKPALNPYLIGILLVMMSGGAILQILKLFGVNTEITFD
ncbi:hypothetical protein FBU30_004511 [Linnemannia zychae]|nr:hypothetical protein FBU30_004511 [Linnemannia zychae]